MKPTNTEKAEILAQALPYIQKYTGKIVVIKYGGDAMENEELKKAVMRDIVLLNQIGIKTVLIHGGDKDVNDVLNKMNVKPQFVDGLSVIDNETMRVMQMVLAGKVNKDLVNHIENVGGKAIGLCGIDGHMIEAKKSDDKWGFVGEITKIDAKPIFDVLAAGFVPVIGSIGCDSEGNVYNINADTVAARIAGEIRATSLISMTDVKGILRDKTDENSLIKAINVSETAQYIKEGIIEGCMIPKVLSCVEAIRRGVGRVFIIDERVPHGILVEILSDEGLGTMFY